ncbi:MAG: penicillin acylase family protein, partial [Pararhizobium sp.]
MRRLLKGFAAGILVAVPVVLVAGAAALFWMSRSLPANSGEARVPGLSADVTITRDSYGVPHIDGATRADVYAGLGFAQAQDRLWQMELNRMAGQGRLSEIFGKVTIPTDVWLRTMDLYGAARDSLKVLSPAARSALDAYARGVNAFLAMPARPFGAKLPPEFVFFRHMPEPWTAVDTLVTIKMMSVSLAENAADELNRLAFARAGLTSAEIDDLMPPLAVDHPPALPDLVALLDLPSGPLVGATTGQLIETALAKLPWAPGTGASNNWVVSGSRTASGKPILANDPHLGLTAPSIWYLADLRVEKEFGTPRNLTGVTLPGTPFVLLGHGSTFAWGFTNTGSDVQDIFVEKTDPKRPGEYRTPGGWAHFGEKAETIHVRGGKDVTFTRRWTRHGPVLPASYGRLGELLAPDEVAALSWTALAHDDTTAMAGFDMWTIRTVADFENGMASFETPMQSMVVADTAGSIGMIAPGRVPVRDPAN